MSDTTAPAAPAANWRSTPPPPPPVPSGAKPDNRGFLRRTWQVLVGIKDGLALLLLLGFFIGLFALLANRPNASLPVREGALLISLDGVVSEQPADVDPLAALQGQTPIPEYRLRDIVHGLKVAADDKRIKVVVLDLDSFMGGGQVALAEIGEALDGVRAKKKPVLAFATGYSDDAYQLAAHASEIWTDPMGGALFAGPGGSRLYYKGLIERLGVTANIYRVGTFKSAIEPFIRADQSPEAREATLAYASVLWDKWQADVQKARPTAKLAPFIAAPGAAMAAADGNLAKANLAAGIVDKIGNRLAFETRVGELAGREDDDKPWAYQAIPLSNWVAANAPDEDGTAIAVIPLVGEIVDGEAPAGTIGGDTAVANILDAMTNEDVKAIVLRVDSPGGSVLASEQIRQALLRAKAKKLPIVVSMANVAASGGYWVSMPADRIFAEPDTITGSIGVFALIPTFENSLGKIGVTSDGITTTPLSGQPDLFGGVNDELNTIVQASVEDIYRQFTGLAAKSRKMPIDKMLPIAEGRVWAGGTAQQLGLVDQFGGLNDAIAHAAKLAKVEGATYPLYFESSLDPVAALIASLTGGRAAADRPRGLVGLTGTRQLQMQAQIARDLRWLTRASSVQASCLECRSHLPMANAARADMGAGWLARLAAGAPG